MAKCLKIIPVFCICLKNLIFFGHAIYRVAEADFFFFKRNCRPFVTSKFVKKSLICILEVGNFYRNSVTCRSFTTLKKSFCKKEIKSKSSKTWQIFRVRKCPFCVKKIILQRRRKFSPPLEIAKFNGIFGQPWNLVNSS